MVDAVKVLFLKKEVTYGTDSVPTGAANGWITSGFQAKPIETDKLDRNLDTGVWGSKKSGTSNERQTFSFDIDLAGSGAAGTAPRWMDGLEACGMAPPTVTAGVKVEQKFALASAAQGSVSTRHYIGDQLRKGVGARGTWSLDMTAGKYPTVSFAFTALLPAAAPFSTAAAGAVDLTAWKEPVEVNSVNTAILLDGYAVVLRTLKIESGLSINLRNLVGARYVNRGPHAVTGSLLIEAPGAAKDYIAALRAGTEVALSVVHGLVAGNIIELAAPRVQITDIAESEEDGKLMWTLTVQFNALAGGDELTITTK